MIVGVRWLKSTTRSISVFSSSSRCRNNFSSSSSPPPSNSNSAAHEPSSSSSSSSSSSASAVDEAELQSVERDKAFGLKDSLFGSKKSLSDIPSESSENRGDQSTSNSSSHNTDGVVSFLKSKPPATGTVATAPLTSTTTFSDLNHATTSNSLHRAGSLMSSIASAPGTPWSPSLSHNAANHSSRSGADASSDSTRSFRHHPHHYQQSVAVPGALGPHKIVVEDLPASATDAKLLDVLNVDCSELRTKSTLGSDATTVVPNVAVAADSTNHINELERPTAIEFFPDRLRGRARRNAFVYYSTARAAARVLARVSKFGVHVDGVRCPIYPSSSKTVLFIGSLRWSISDDDTLRAALARAGIDLSLCTVELAIDEQRRASRGFAYLRFETHEAALQAFRQLLGETAPLELGRTLSVGWAPLTNRLTDEGRSSSVEVRRLQDEIARLRLELAETRLVVRTQQLQIERQHEQAQLAAHKSKAAYSKHKSRKVANKQKQQQQQSQQQTTIAQSFVESDTAPETDEIVDQLKM